MALVPDLARVRKRRHSHFQAYLMQQAATDSMPAPSGRHASDTPGRYIPATTPTRQPRHPGAAGGPPPGSSSATPRTAVRTAWVKKAAGTKVPAVLLNDVVHTDKPLLCSVLASTPGKHAVLGLTHKGEIEFRILLEHLLPASTANQLLRAHEANLGLPDAIVLEGYTENDFVAGRYEGRPREKPMGAFFIKKCGASRSVDARTQTSPFEGRTVNGPMRELLIKCVRWTLLTNNKEGTKGKFAFTMLQGDAPVRDTVDHPVYWYRDCVREACDLVGKTELEAALAHCKLVDDGSRIPGLHSLQGTKAALDALQELVATEVDHDLALSLAVQGLQVRRSSHGSSLARRACFLSCNGQVSEPKWSAWKACRCGLVGLPESTLTNEQKKCKCGCGCRKARKKARTNSC